MNLPEIQHAIEELPAEQQTALTDWLAARDRERWDEEICRDFSPGGAGESILRDAESAVRKGQSRPLLNRR